MHNTEWTALFKRTEENIKVSEQPCELPEISRVKLAKHIDHTLLKLDATEAQIDELCSEARKYGFAVYSLPY